MVRFNQNRCISIQCCSLKMWKWNSYWGEREREREKDVHNTHELGASHIEVCLFRAIKLVPEVKYFQLTKLDVEVSVCAVVPTQA